MFGVPPFMETPIFMKILKEISSGRIPMGLDLDVIYIVKNFCNRPAFFSRFGRVPLLVVISLLFHECPVRKAIIHLTFPLR